MPIGVDITAFCPREHSKLNPDKVVLLFAGVMHYQPNVDAALFLIREIMPRLKHNIELRIVGRGPTAEIIESAKNDSRIVVTGTVPDIIGEHQNSDIFVAPMISGAGIKIKILQAMACGLPVITTSVCVRAFPETPAGLLTGDSVDQLVFMINRLIANVTEREQLGREGRMFVEKKWSWEQRTKKLVKIYTEVADCKRVSRA